MAQPRSYKFMTNILSEAKHRTRYVSLLKDLTPDAQVSYQRIFLSLGMIVALVGFFLFSLNHADDKLGYVMWPLVTITAGFAVLIVLFIISSRSKSMLTSVWDFMYFQIYERSRRRTARNSRMSGVGIDRVDAERPDGGGVAKIRFTNGDVGVMYDVEGQLSLSVLPSVVNATADARVRYFATRMPTTTEHLITSVKRADVTKKLNYLRRVNENAKAEKDQFSESMSSMIYGYVDTQLGENENQLFQSLIIRETDEASLDKARRYFHDAVNSGIYAFVTPLEREDVIYRLRSTTMLSDEAVRELNENITTGKDDK